MENKDSTTPAPDHSGFSWGTFSEDFWFRYSRGGHRIGGVTSAVGRPMRIA
jgi:hypothetical protein